MGIINTEKLGRFLSNLKSNFAQQLIESQPDTIYTATSTDGISYSVTVPGVTSLYSGLRITVKFSRNSASTTPTLNVNNLGVKNIRQSLSVNNSATAPGSLNTWLTTSCPIVLIYNGSLWKTEIVRPSASGLYGTTPIANGGTGATTAEQALENLGGASVTYVDSQIASLISRIEALES